jgi:hypothetical protein
VPGENEALRICEADQPGFVVDESGAGLFRSDQIRAPFSGVKRWIRKGASMKRVKPTRLTASTPAPVTLRTPAAPLTPMHGVIRDLAHRLKADAFDHVVADDADAIRIVVEVLHDGACPRCGSLAWKPRGVRHLACRRCGDVPAFASSLLSKRRLPPRTFLAAIFAICVDTQTISARGFSRRMKLRLATAWALLHEMRDALPHLAPDEPALVLPVRCGGDASDVAFAAHDDHRLAVVPADAVAVVGGAARADMPLWWGRLRGWLNEVFRGVSARHLHRYLCEFAARHGRVQRGGASHVDPGWLVVVE